MPQPEVENMRSLTLGEFCNVPGYSVLYVHGNPTKEIEKDDDKMSVHLTFKPNRHQLSLFNMMKTHADLSFSFVATRQLKNGVEHQYFNEFGKDYSVILYQSYITNNIRITFDVISKSHAALQKIIDTDITEINCIQSIRDVIHTAAVDDTKTKLFERGTLRGDYCGEF